MSPKAASKPQTAVSDGTHPLAAPPSATNGRPATVPAAAAAQLSATSSVVAHDGPLTVKAYRGDGCVLIAMDVQQSACAGLAGFAIARSTDGVTFTFAPNRLSFKAEKGITAATTTEQRRAMAETTDIAPYQKFRWVDYPPQTVDGPYTYRVEALYFIPGKDPAGGAGALQSKAKVTFALPLTGKISPDFDIAFTRGYVSSQAFVDRYGSNVKSLRLDDTVDYDTRKVVTGTSTTPPTTYRDMYHWLGNGARTLLSNFLMQCETDGVATGSGYDVFAYDLDEPDFLKVLVRDAERGWPVRMVLDDAPLHTKKGAREIEAAKLLEGSKVQVVRGHFKRFAHDKCVIQRDKAGNAIRVLTGSANFSVRGLYVQSNSMLTIDDPDVAKLYGQAFDQAFTAMGKFTSAPIAAKWFDFDKPNLPKFSVSFAPHKSAAVSLKEVSDAINGAKSSVLFAVMGLTGGGDVLKALNGLLKKKNVFSYGVTQAEKGLTFTKSGKPGLLVPFGYLKAKVPEPFREEWNGGMGQVIHHKFVVVDFNTPNAVVFCGSSNLAEGGEQSNGDNLLAIRDPAVAALYAVEAIQLVDHYEFRAVQSTITKPQDAMTLAGPDAKPQWWESFYDPKNLKSRERTVLVE
jgi:hypothetical protein